MTPRSEKAVEAANRAAEAVEPTCNVCGVAYVDDFEGPCQEPRPPYEDPSRTCPGKVGIRPADIAAAALEAAEPIIREEEREAVRKELQDAFDHILNAEGKLPGLHDIFDRVFPGWATLDLPSEGEAE